MIPFFSTGTDLKDMIRQINEEMAKIYAWVNANKLSLNIDKTNFIMFMPKGFSYSADYIVINRTRKQEVKETTFLGVIIDNKLKWSAHISYISKKISKGIGIILKSKKVFSNDTLLSLYHTFVYPYLSYCIHVWGKAYKTHLNDLVVLQNTAMRIINGVPPRTNMDNFYIENNILTVKHIYNYSIGLLIKMIYFFAVICQCKMINILLWDSSECREYKLHFFFFFFLLSLLFNLHSFLAPFDIHLV